MGRVFGFFVLICASFSLHATMPGTLISTEGVVVEWDGGLVFRFSRDGDNIYALEDPKGLVGAKGGRIRIEGELIRKRFNYLPMVRVTSVIPFGNEGPREGPFMQPAGPGTSLAFYQQELAYAARLRGGVETSDTDGDGTPDVFDTDDDNDGMPDTYETAQGLNSKVNDAQQDSDGDLMVNIDEYEAGFAAGDPLSFFQVLSVNVNVTQVCLTFTSVTGKSYRIMMATAPGETPTPVATQVPAKTGESATTICVPIPESTGVFYIQLEQP